MSNLFKRILVGAVGIPLLLALAIVGGWPMTLLILVLQAVALWEWIRVCRANGITPNAAGIVIGVIGLDTFVFSYGDSHSITAILAALSMMLLLEVLRRERQPLRDLSAAFLFLGYIALPFALWSQLQVSAAADDREPMGVLAVLFVATWVCDTAAYFIGRRFGRHKLDVQASPNKTIEGFIGGAAATFLVLPLLSTFNLVSPTALDYFALPVIVGIGGQAGDLLESLVKREAQLKDTSAILPGHGGILDRFDSMFVSTPLLFAYLLIKPA